MLVHQDGFNQHRRRLQIGLELRRIHRCKSFDGRKPQPAVGRAAGGGLRAGGTFARRQSIGLAISPAGNDFGRAGGKIVQRLLRNAHQSFVGADPQTSRVILGDVIDAVAGESVRGGIARPLAILKPRQSVAAGANPQHAVLVRVKTRNVIAGQAVASLTPGGEFSVLVKIQSAALRAGPEISDGVLRNGSDGIVRKTVARREQFPFLPVKVCKAVLSSGPKPPVPPFKQRENFPAQNFRAGCGNKMIGLEQEQTVIPRSDPDLLPAVHQRFPGIPVLARVIILHGIGRPMRHAERPESHPQSTGHILGK